MYDVFLKKHDGPWCKVATFPDKESARIEAERLHDQDGDTWEARYYHSDDLTAEFWAEEE